MDARWRVHASQQPGGGTILRIVPAAAARPSP